MGWIALALAAVTLLAYGRVGSCGFVNLDDDAYVEFAPMVNKGLRAAAVVWAWTAPHSSNWHPLTTLSHLLDCTWWGVRAAPMHWENVAWHVANTLLVFAALRLLTGAIGRPAIVAALFALHPLHVESVAWISERKDVLCTFFWLLAIVAHAAWTRRGGAARQGALIACTAAALLAKPMAVTLPVTLLLLDYWPLRRLTRSSLRRRIREKLPLVALVAGQSVITFIVQHRTGAADYGQRFTLAARAGNAAVAYARYLGKMAWPRQLAPLYDHPGYWPPAAVAGAVLLLAVASFVAWRQRRRRPWLLCGWSWYLLTLVPVIGFVQVGAQSMADRYTYVPLLGIFFALVWSVAEFAANSAARQAWIAAGAALGAGLVVLTNRQVGAWKNSEQLYRHSLAVGEDSAPVRYLLAVALQAAHRPETEVVAEFRRATEIKPDYVNAHLQLAAIALRHQRYDEARRIVEQTLRYEPRNPALHLNQGMVALWQGRRDEARAAFETALQLNPNDSEARRQLALLALQQNRPDEAKQQYEELVRRDPWNSAALTELGNLLGNSREFAPARACLARAVWIDPDNPTARASLATINQDLRASGH